MTDISKFRNHFDETLRDAARVLEDADYTVENYKALLRLDRETDFYHFHESDPLVALDQTIEEIGEQGILSLPVSGERIAAVMKQELDPHTLIYPDINGGIDIKDPKIIENGYEHEKFGTSVHYIHDYPGDIFEIHISSDRGSTIEEREKRASNIADLLENSGYNINEFWVA